MRAMRRALLLSVALLVVAVSSYAFVWVLAEGIGTAISRLVLSNYSKRALLFLGNIAIGYGVAKLYTSMQEKGYVVDANNMPHTFDTFRKTRVGEALEEYLVSQRVRTTPALEFNDYRGNPHPCDVYINDKKARTFHRCFIKSYSHNSNYGDSILLVCPVASTASSDTCVYEEVKYFVPADALLDIGKLGDVVYVYDGRSFVEDLIDGKVKAPRPDRLFIDEDGDGVFDREIVGTNEGWEVVDEEQVQDDFQDFSTTAEVVDATDSIVDAGTEQASEVSDYFEDFPKEEEIHQDIQQETQIAEDIEGEGEGESEGEGVQDSEADSQAESQTLTADEIAQAIDDRIAKDVQGVSVPALPDVPVFDTTVETPETPDIVSKVLDFLSVFDFQRRIQTDFSGYCRFNDTITLFGRSTQISIDFCRFQNELAQIGDVLKMIAIALSILLVVGV